MSNGTSKRDRDAIRGRSSVLRRFLCVALSCLIAVPFGSTALLSSQAAAEPVDDAASSETAPGELSASASATIEVADTAAANALEAAEAAHMPTLEEYLGGGSSF